MKPLVSLLLVFFLTATARAADPAPRAAEFFETKVRPVLAEHCFSCHGPKKQQAGLRLDSGEAALKGGDEGPVIERGQPEKSALIKAIRQDGDIKMPPKGKLPAQVIEDL